jgi:hypothetical protein
MLFLVLELAEDSPTLIPHFGLERNTYVVCRIYKVKVEGEGVFCELRALRSIIYYTSTIKLTSINNKN